ncbi:MAG: SCO family protein [Magnetococcales bacterium]|nr:SCO family protein [Magnetococcales bacterium]
MSNTENGISMKQVAIIFIGASLFFAALSIGLNYFNLNQPTQKAPEALKALLLDSPKVVPDFDLIDQAGQPFTQDNLKGQWNITFFGYTHCPDVCPLALGKMAELFTRLGEVDDPIAKTTRAVFVSVDPLRDTADVLKEYIGYFNPDFVGVTGPSQDAVDKLAKPVGAGYIIGDKDEHGDYVVNHTSAFYLIDPDGRFVGMIYPDRMSMDSLFAEIREVQKYYASLK